MYESQKKANKVYREKLKMRGITQHPILCTQQEYNILKTILKVLRFWKLDSVSSIDADDESKTIRLIDNE